MQLIKTKKSLAKNTLIYAMNLILSDQTMKPGNMTHGPEQACTMVIEKPNYFDANIAKWMMRDYMLSEVENKLKISACTSAKIVDLNVAKIVDCYDLIFSSMVLHHIADHKQTITNLSQSLLPGGYLCICD